MPIQITFTDVHKDLHPQAYAIIEEGHWKRLSGGFQIRADIYASKAAFEAGGTPVHSGDMFVPFDSSGMTGAIEQYLMAHDAVLSAGSPQQVA